MYEYSRDHSYLLQMYRVPHLQEQYEMPRQLHLTRAQADAIEARADKGDADLHLKLDASVKLPAALVTKLESAADAIDQKLHTFVEAHVVADPALQQLYCQLNLAHLKDCFWVNIKWLSFTSFYLKINKCLTSIFYISIFIFNPKNVVYLKLIFID